MFLFCEFLTIPVVLLLLLLDLSRYQLNRPPGSNRPVTLNAKIACAILTETMSDIRLKRCVVTMTRPVAAIVLAVIFTGALAVRSVTAQTSSRFSRDTPPRPVASSIPSGAPFAGPIRVAANGRYLTDAEGNPFFWLGDTPWQLFTSYTPADIQTYLDDRQAKGFTVVQAVLCWWTLSGPACRDNTDGQNPFLNNNPATPNDAFFGNVDAIVDAAAVRGIVVAMLPVWSRSFISGVAPGDSTLVNTTNARAYGRYLGNRYKDRSNIIWLLGGDTAVLDKATVYQELAAGIQEFDIQAKALGYHPNTATYDQGNNPYPIPETALNFHMAQSYKRLDQIPFLLSNMYQSHPTKPAILAEGSYEGGWVDFDCCGSYPPVDNPWALRKQAYWSYLGGGFYTYGHDAIWSHGEWPSGGPWQSALNAPGAQAMTIVKNTLTSREWWELAPYNAIFANGEGLGLWQNAAAIDRSGGSAMVYLSMSAPIALDLTKITQGGVIRATWTDPRNGDQVDGGLYRKAIQTLVPPDGFEDALLLLEGVAPQGGRRPF
jgi:hypothetical protein